MSARTCASRLSVNGQTSGQFVKPKNSSVNSPLKSLKCASRPGLSTKRTSASGRGSGKLGRRLRRCAALAARQQEHGRDEHDQGDDEDSQHSAQHAAIIAYAGTRGCAVERCRRRAGALPRVSCAPHELRTRATLRSARDCDEWIAALAEYFAAHELAFGHGTDNASDEAFWLLRHLQGWRDVDFARAAGGRAGAAGARDRRAPRRGAQAARLSASTKRGSRVCVLRRRARARAALAARRGRRARGSRRGARSSPAIACSTSARAAAASRSRRRTTAPTSRSMRRTSRPPRSPSRPATSSATASRERVRLFEADLFPPQGERYRVIVSNPPYVPEGEVAALPPEYRHEPVLGLASGADGFAAAERILRGAARPARRRTACCSSSSAPAPTRSRPRIRACR